MAVFDFYAIAVSDNGYSPGTYKVGWSVHENGIEVARCAGEEWAEKITSALNSAAATAAKPSNHNIAEVVTGQAHDTHTCANGRGGRRCDVCFGELRS